MLLRFALAALMVLLAAPPARPQSLDDLPALLQCTAKPDGYFAFRRWLSAGGQPAARIGLLSDGIVAEVPNTTPAALARRLGMDPPLQIGTISQTTRLVEENQAAIDRRAHPPAPPSVDDLFAAKPPPGPDAQQTVQLVTNLGQRGRTMAGCNYLSSRQSAAMPFPVR